MADKVLKIESITELQECQVRGGLNPRQVAEYRDLIDSGVEMDSIDVFCDPTDSSSPNWVSDGFHRLAAYKQAGRDRIPCQIHEGNLSAALEFALSKNSRHGAAVTNAQKRQMVKMALADTRIRRLSDKRIARMCGVSASFVGQMRSGKADKPAKERQAKSGNPQAPSSEPVRREDPEPRVAAEPATKPVVTQERNPAVAPTKVETLDEKMKTITDWIKAGYIDLPAIVSAAETKKHRLVIVPKKDLMLVIAAEGVEVRQYPLAKLEMVDGKIQVELKEGTVI